MMLPTTTERADERTKLLLARAEIAELLKRHGLLAHVILGGQYGLIELMCVLDAPWSCLSLERGPNGEPGIRLRSKAEETAPRDIRLRNVASSVAFADSSWQTLGGAAMHWQQAAEAMNAEIGATHTPLEPDPPQ